MTNIQLKEGAKLIPFLEDVIKELARTNPDWTFHSNATTEARKIGISCGQEGLGTISADTKYVRGERSYVFCIEGWRIDKMRQRGSGIQTSKPKEVFKAIKKYIYPLTKQEHFDRGFSEAHHIISLEYRVAVQTVSNRTYELRPAFIRFTQSRWKEFVETLDQTEKGHAMNLLEYQQKANAAKKLFDEVDNKKCLTVHLTDGKYTVQQGEVLQDYESASLPEHIRTKVGLLKLVEEKEVLPEVGVRVGNVYVIRP